jgi:hypothetical protein
MLLLQDDEKSNLYLYLRIYINTKTKPKRRHESFEVEQIIYPVIFRFHAEKAPKNLSNHNA